MMPAVLSLSATEIENSFPPQKKSLPFSNLLLIALGSPPLNNQSTDTFFLRHFFNTPYHPSFNPLPSIPMSPPFPFPPTLRTQPTSHSPSFNPLPSILMSSLFPSTLRTHSTPHSPSFNPLPSILMSFPFSPPPSVLIPHLTHTFPPQEMRTSTTHG